jgi:hypothetical protein
LWVTLAAGAVAVGVFEADDDEELLDEPGWPAVRSTCWTNGSLAVKWLKAKSCALLTLGKVSEFGSFELAGVRAAAAVPGAVVGVAVTGVPVVGAAGAPAGVEATAVTG